MDHFKIADLVIFSSKVNDTLSMGIRSDANDDNTRVSPVYLFDRSYNTIDELFKEALLLKERLQSAFEREYVFSGDSLHKNGNRITLPELLETHYDYDESKSSSDESNAVIKKENA